MKLSKKELKKPQNILTIARIPLSFIMFIAVFINEWLFLVLLIITALTDMFDGIIARARDEASKLGSHLDSVADHVFYPLLIIATAFLVPSLYKSYLLPVLFIVGWWAINTAIMRIRFKKITFIHLHSVRYSVVFFFFLAILIVLDKFVETFFIITLFAFAIRLTEETYVFLAMPANKINPDLRFFWQLHKGKAKKKGKK